MGAGVTRGVTARAPVLDGVAMVPPDGAGVMNDASGLSPVSVHKHIVLTDDPGEALLAALRTELREAAAAGRSVNIGAARHSMGAQALPAGGHAVTFDNGLVEPGAAMFRAHAGARWGQVIAALDPVGLSPRVMQSNNDFGVAATFSVNAHGWPVAQGPMGATVRQVKMLLADGSHITASRT